MGSTTRARLPAWLRTVYAAPNALFEHGLGWVLGRRFVQITHVGRRTGRVHHAVVEVIGYDEATGQTTVMSGYGERSDWFRNIRAAGRAELDFGHGPRPADVRVLPVEEAVTVFRRYEHRNRLLMPAVRLYLTRGLLGWRYDSSPRARRRLAEELPFVAFTPQWSVARDV